MSQQTAATTRCSGLMATTPCRAAMATISLTAGTAAILLPAGPGATPPRAKGGYCDGFDQSRVRHGFDLSHRGWGNDCRSLDVITVLSSLVDDVSAGGSGANSGDGSTNANIEQIEFTGGAGADTATGGAFHD